MLAMFGGLSRVLGAVVIVSGLARHTIKNTYQQTRPDRGQPVELHIWIARYRTREMNQ